MEQLFNVKLYRSPLHAIINIVILLISIFSILRGITFLILNLTSGITLHELFYEPYEGSLFFDDFATIYGTLAFAEFIFGFVFYIFLLIVSLFALSKNRIIVYNEYVKIQFLPRYLKRYIRLKNIIDIIPVHSVDISLFQRIINLNFSKKHLYKITTKYNETIILACVDESGLERLRTIIKEKQEQGKTGNDSLSSND